MTASEKLDVAYEIAAGCHGAEECSRCAVMLEALSEYIETLEDPAPEYFVV